LEIGSYLGGSIQQHLVYPKCKKIYSIDRRRIQVPDDRAGGTSFRYEGNSTERMLSLLRSLGSGDITKITCFDTDARNIDPSLITEPPDFCFIDGEHTQFAAIADFTFCMKVCSPNAAICFHDDDLIPLALSLALRMLNRSGIPYTPLKLGGSTFMIALRDCPV